MKIYLIAPRNPESFWTFDRILPSLKKKCVFPEPVAADGGRDLTPRQHEVVLCDENVEPIDFDTDADIVGITGYVIHKQRMFEIAAEFKRRGKFVVAGGPFASLCPEELRGKVDVLFVDEAEYTWPQFLARLRRRDLAGGIPAGRQAEHARLAAAALRPAEGRSLPHHDHPVRARLPLQLRILRHHRHVRPPAAHQDGRAGDGGGARAFTRSGSRNIFVVDDNFIGNKKEAKALLARARRLADGARLPDRVHDRGDAEHRAGRRAAALMQQANFTTIFVGIESPRAASLQETHKTQNLRESILDSVHRIQRAGIEVMAGMIVGFDTTTRRSSTSSSASSRRRGSRSR